MDVSISMSLIRLPMKLSSTNYDETTRSSLSSSSSSSSLFMNKQCFQTSRLNINKKKTQKMKLFVVEAKGKKGMMTRQFQPQQQPPPLPKIEDDGNPRFVIFIRPANVFLWYPLTLVTGGTTAKIMVAAKDNFLGKYIYKNTIARNLAAVVYQDEKATIRTAQKQNRILRNATEFRFGYKLVEGTNVRAALTPKNVIELPTPDQLKTVLDKVQEFFGGAKESFGKLTSLNTGSADEEESSAKQPK